MGNQQSDELLKLPTLARYNAREVYDRAVAETRLGRSQDCGISRGHIDENALRRAESTFMKLNLARYSSVLPLSSLGMVFSDLGVELTAENLEDICDQFEIARSTELTFPEVVDIASFLLGESVP